MLTFKMAAGGCPLQPQWDLPQECAQLWEPGWLHGGDFAVAQFVKQ